MYEFSKAQRLLKKSDFDFVFKQAKSVTNSEILILYRENQLGYARLGLAISKKILPKAHDRNKVKRLMRETFRMIELPAIDIIILAKKGAKKDSITFARINKLWEKLTNSYKP